MKVTLISDTHTRHHLLDLPGGDVLVHAGDLMNSGYSRYEIKDFLDWFDSQNYDTKIFIAGNHDRVFEDDPDYITELMKEYPGVTYLQDSEVQVGEDWADDKFRVWGSPWQPEFYNWAFNLPRRGPGLQMKWNQIPKGLGILVTHGPPQEILDVSGPPYNEPLLGCELLRVTVDEVKPKIHVFGHIHGSYGYKYLNGTHFFNAAVLGENYELQTDRPFTFEWDPITNEIEFID